MNTIKVDVCVVGASIGGTLATYSLAKEGKKVLLVEECDWIGGQLTSQAVPPDEHKWIEKFGCTKTYRNFRNRIRTFYKQNYPCVDEIMESEIFDPGNSSVSRIAHEPRISLHLLNEMILPYISNNNINILLNNIAINSEVIDDEIKSITIKNTINGEETKIIASYFIDGTDTGELLPITNTEYITGAESKEMTKELHAGDKFEPKDMQPITWVAAVDFVEGEDNTIEKPAEYDYFKALKMPYDKYPIFSWYGADSSTGRAKKFGMFTDQGENLFPLWSYRRIIYPQYFKDNFQKTDVMLLNWPQNDYFMDNIFETENDEHNKYMAKQLTLSFIYWLQTEAEREDGGIGYKEIRLRADIVGSKDGLAKMPYIRESRRIKAEYTVVEEDINSNCRDTLKTYNDTVGVGCYHIDLHITTVTNTFMYTNSWPFEIPLGAIIPIRMKNLIPACKNIGTTHLTNGCFRLHPVEWNIGEVAGYIASFSLDNNITPSQVRNNNELLKKFQYKLINEGIELHWPKDEVHPI